MQYTKTCYAKKRRRHHRRVDKDGVFIDDGNNKAECTNSERLTLGVAALGARVFGPRVYGLMRVIWYESEVKNKKISLLKACLKT